MRRLLVVRRDNIGDLVCTLPLAAALRRRFPEAWIGAWVNSYNAPVLAGFEGLDAVFAYTKLKHLEAGESALGAVAAKLRSLARLRRMRLDCVVLANPDFSARNLRLARWLGARSIAGFSDGSRAARALALALPAGSVEAHHEVERVFALARLFGIEGPIPPIGLAAPRQWVRAAQEAYGSGGGMRVAVHISARRPAQRWPAARFAELILRLHAQLGARCLLLWAPGASANPRHPGDDEKAAEVMERVGGRAPLAALRTERLAQLMGALGACEAAVCPDGGAMHIAAGLGKPVVALFGDSNPRRWHPWGVPHRVVRPQSRRLEDLDAGEVIRAFRDLQSEGSESPGWASGLGAA
ncbi:MAG: glycosyltransferase family 9 protein [Burkholderiales bacterium]|nr:glycosyltransferase family 9 protein [Burkholderiales bacterium]